MYNLGIHWKHMLESTSEIQEVTSHGALPSMTPFMLIGRLTGTSKERHHHFQLHLEGGLIGHMLTLPDSQFPLDALKTGQLHKKFKPSGNFSWCIEPC